MTFSLGVSIFFFNDDSNMQSEMSNHKNQDIIQKKQRYASNSDWKKQSMQLIYLIHKKNCSREDSAIHV